MRHGGLPEHIEQDSKQNSEVRRPTFKGVEGGGSISAGAPKAEEAQLYGRGGPPAAGNLHHRGMNCTLAGRTHAP